MSDEVFRLFDEYASRFARGERPDVRAYLQRADERSGELAQLIDRYLEGTAPPPPDEDAVTLAQAWLAAQPPLLELRAGRGLPRDEVVDVLVERLGLDRAKRDKVKRYYHELESGLLDPARVDGRVWTVLADLLRARVGDLRAWHAQLPEIVLEPAYRVDPAIEMPASPARPIQEPEPQDEIDRLFGGIEDTSK